MANKSIWTIESLKEHFDALRVEDLRARELTEGRMNDRFEEHNRFREQINHERTNYVTRDQLDAVKDTQIAAQAATQKALDLREGQSKGIGLTGQTVLSLLTAAAAIVAIGVAFLK